MDRKSSRTTRDLELEAEELSKATMQSLGRSLHLARQTVDIGDKTIEELEHQGEQLERIDQKAAHVLTVANSAKATIKDMERGFLASLLLPSHQHWAKSGAPAKESRPRTPETPVTPVTQSSASARAQLLRRTDQAPRLASASSTGRAQNPVSALDQQMAEPLDELSSYINIMKQQSLQMGQMLSRQEELIDHIDETVATTRTSVEKSTAKTNKMLKH